MVVSNIFFSTFQPYLGKWSNFDWVFQRDWNHQLEMDGRKMLHFLLRPFRPIFRCVNAVTFREGNIYGWNPKQCCSGYRPHGWLDDHHHLWCSVGPHATRHWWATLLQAGYFWDSCTRNPSFVMKKPKAKGKASIGRLKMEIRPTQTCSTCLLQICLCCWGSTS